MMMRARRFIGTTLAAGWLAFTALSALNVSCPMHASSVDASGGAQTAHAHGASGLSTPSGVETHAHETAHVAPHAGAHLLPEGAEDEGSREVPCDCTSSCGLSAAHTPHALTVAHAETYVAFAPVAWSRAEKVFALQAQFVLPFATAPPLV